MLIVERSEVGVRTIQARPLDSSSALQLKAIRPCPPQKCLRNIYRHLHSFLKDDLVGRSKLIESLVALSMEQRLPEHIEGLIVPIEVCEPLRDGWIDNFHFAPGWFGGSVAWTFRAWVTSLQT